MKNYTVKWEVQLTGENPKDAAEKALKAMLFEDVRVFETKEEIMDKVELVNLSET